MGSYTSSSPAPSPFSGVGVATGGGGRGGWEGGGGEGTIYSPGGFPRGLVTGPYSSSGLSPCFVAVLAAVVVVATLFPSGEPGSVVNSCLSGKGRHVSVSVCKRNNF